MMTTFSGCTSLINGPKIPYGVTNMHGTFENCTSLVTPPSVIPDTVINMPFTFYNCVNLQGNIQINANIQGVIVANDVLDYHACFTEAGKNGSGLTILKSSTTSLEMLNNLIDGNIKITIEQ